MYKCGKCKKEISEDQLHEELGVRCPFCGGVVLYKARPPVVVEFRVA